MAIHYERSLLIQYGINRTTTEIHLISGFRFNIQAISEGSRSTSLDFIWYIYLFACMTIQTVTGGVDSENTETLNQIDPVHGSLHYCVTIISVCDVAVDVALNVTFFFG